MGVVISGTVFLGGGRGDGVEYRRRLGAAVLWRIPRQSVDFPALTSTNERAGPGGQALVGQILMVSRWAFYVYLYV